MKRKLLAGLLWPAFLTALVAGAAHATPLVNGATIETRTFNDCPISTVTTVNNYPDQVEITDDMNPACIGFANLHSFSFSADGGATAAAFDNPSSFRFGADVTLSGAGGGEGGLRLSPWWAKTVDGRFMLNATTGEIACFGGRLPFYSFTVNHGVSYVKGTTVRLEIEYEPNGLIDVDPATIVYRLVQGGTTYESPVLPFDMGNPAEDPPYGLWGILNDARAGGYFQARANTGAALTATWANIVFRSEDCPCEVDLDAPELTVSLSPDALWPPNHKLVDVHANVTVTDDCDDAPEVTLVSVTSDEPDNGLGDGDTADDIQIVGDLDLLLRSERQGGGDGRVYTVCYRATDEAGNTTLACGTVTVPHDRSGHATLLAGAAPVDLVIHGSDATPARGIAAGGLLLGTGTSARLAIAAPASFADRDGDGVEDAVFRLSATEADWAREAAQSGSGLYARLTDANGGVLAPVELDELTGVGTPLPTKLAVSVRPNPAVGVAFIRCALPKETAVQLSVYDVAGREVGRLVDGVLPAGEHALSWRPSQAAGAGFYLYRLRTREGTIQGRFIVIR